MDKTIKVVNPTPKQKTKRKKRTKSDTFSLTLALIGLSYLVLLTVISFLPLPFSIKFVGLIIGSFILIDIFHGYKAYVRRKNSINRQTKS